MTDVLDEGAAGAEAGQDAPETPTTEYVVMVVADVVDETATVGGLAPELWREAGVLSVPQRTQRATVLDRAGDMAARFAKDGKARFRVWPLCEQQEGTAELEPQPPQLKVTAL